MTFEASAEDVGQADVRPVVALPRKALSGAMLLAIAVIAGLILFAVLEIRRHGLNTPTVPATGSIDFAQGSVIPPLFIPPLVQRRPQDRLPDVSLAIPASPIPAPRPPRDFNYTPAPQPQFVQGPTPSPQPPVQIVPRNLGGSVLVIDGSRQAATPAGDAGNPAGAAPGTGHSSSTVQSGGRARASRLANQGRTIVQGTIMSAVLETGLDSTRPGLVRALIQHDVLSFDGTTILVPRGSRVIGEYGSGVEVGQRRAAILWTRLIRPDGVTIALGSPATDQQGRTGMRARVNTHFWQRFGDAFLQTLLDVGGQLAIDQVGSPVVVALPGAVQGGIAGRSQQSITPTLRVTPGTSVNIFVARDLDFSSIEGG